MQLCATFTKLFTFDLLVFHLNPALEPHLDLVELETIHKHCLAIYLSFTATFDVWDLLMNLKMHENWSDLIVQNFYRRPLEDVDPLTLRGLSLLSFEFLYSQRPYLLCN